jgi:hypothetical protein
MSRLLRIVLGIIVVVAGVPRGAVAGTGTTCSWPARLDPNVVNALYPDHFASYWVTKVPAIPGSTLTINGRFPYARYMSFTSYNPALQSVAGIADLDIEPDAGSANPFHAGADRSVAARSYTVTVFPPDHARAPGDPHNALYTTSQDGSKTGTDYTIVYRVYIGDAGTDDRGGVELPSVSINLPDGRTVAIPECDVQGMPDAGLNEILASGNSPVPPAGGGSGENPPVWHKFFNFPTSVAHATDNQRSGQQLADGLEPVTMTVPQGGFADNPDNNYIYTFVNRSNGPVLVVRGRMPSTPDTFGGLASMPAYSDLRYWSLCTNHAPSQRYYSCVYDHQVRVDADGDYTIVIAQPADFDAGACPGVTFLPWGVSNDAVLILRNMLPSPTFAHSIQAARYGHEADDLGPYYPVATYAQAGGCP